MADEIIVETTSTEVVEVGVVGPQGPAGSAGAAGPANALSIGSVTSGASASATITGTAPSQTLSLVLPKGDKGDTGAQGPAGTGIETLTTKGDLLSRDDSAAIRVGIGSTGQVLKVSAQGLPTWANESGAVSSVAGKTGVVTLDKNDVGLGNVSNTAQVTSVTGTAPIVSSGGTTPAISISAATTSAAGSMSAADKTKLDGIAAGAEVNVNADWSATSGDAQILNKPSTFTPTAHAASHAAGFKASYTGIGDIESLATPVTIRASNAGTAGNSITLTFDGVYDIDTVLAAWNSANPSNQATLIVGDGSQVPDNGEEITLAGGVAGGSDPFKNINQDLGTLDKPTFDGLAVGIEAGGYVQSGAHRAQFVATGTQTPITIIGGSGSAEMWKDTGPSAAAAFGFAVPGNAAGNNLVFSDFNGGWSAIFEAPKNAPLDIKTGGVKFADATDNTKRVELSAASVGAGTTRVVTFPNKNITLDDAGDTRTPSSHSHGNLTNDGKVGTDSGRVLVTTTAGAVSTLALGAAGTVLTVNSGATGVEFAAASGSGVSSVSSSASDVLGVSGANITGVDANADRIIFWDDSASALKHLTVGSGLSLTDTTLTATATGTIGGSTSTDNAIVRADSTSNTVQDSALVIDDATTSTQANVAIRNNHSETNSALVLCNKGTGAFIVSPARPDGTSTGGNARGAESVCIIPSRSAATQVASGGQSVAIGRRATASGTPSVAVGNLAAATGNGGSTAVGPSASATTDATALGNSASGTGQGAVVIGWSNTASGNRSVCIGGQSLTASLREQVVMPPFASVYWSGQTTNNTATILSLGGAAGERFTIAASTALAVDILLVARRSDTQDKWLVARRFLGIRRDGSNNTSLIGTVQDYGLDQSAGSPSWTFALTADDTNEALQLEVTGAASETVQWRATAFYRVV